MISVGGNGDQGVVGAKQGKENGKSEKKRHPRLGMSEGNGPASAFALNSGRASGVFCLVETNSD